MKIYKNLNNFTINDFAYKDCYSKEENIYFRIYSSSLKIKDLNNAMKKGQDVNIYSVSFDYNYDSFLVNFSNYLLKNKLDFKSFVELLLNGNIPANNDISVNYDNTKGVRVFTPFAESKNIKIPAKWNISHVIKGIMSGQINNGECEMYLTDDYKLDAALNFRNGNKLDILDLCKDLVEAPSGWWINVEENKDNNYIALGVNQCSFNYNKVYFSLNPVKRNISFDDIKYTPIIDFMKYKANKG